MLFKETAFLRLFGLTKIPMILFTSPTVHKLDEEGCVIEIKLNHRTRNHLKSMYFGALAVGADCCGGMNAMMAIRKSRSKVSLIFKDFHAEYTKRADGNVVFTTRDGRAISEGVAKADATGERINIPVNIIATVPQKYGDEPVAKFVLTLSLKRK